MGIFNLFRTKKNEQVELISHINNWEKKFWIGPMKHDVIRKYCGDDIKIYRVYNKENIIRQLDHLNDFYITKYDHTASIITPDKDFAIFIFDRQGFHEVTKHLLICDSGINKDVLEVMNYKLKTCNASSNIHEYKEIIDKYNCSFNKPLTLVCNVNIIPSHIHYKKKLIKIPIQHRTTHKSITIKYNNDGQLISVILDKRHPNADSKGYYCLGYDKYMKLSIFIIDNLMHTRLLLYDLDDCYYIPAFAQSLIKNI